MESPGLRCASVGGPGANGGAKAVGGGKGGCMDEAGYYGSLMQQQSGGGNNHTNTMVSVRGDFQCVLSS